MPHSSPPPRFQPRFQPQWRGRLSLSLRLRRFRSFVASFPLWAAFLFLWSPLRAQQPLAGQTDQAEPLRVIAIAPAEFLKPVEEYAGQRPGSIAMQVFELEAILQHAQGADDAEKVKRWLYERWAEEKFAHVLLVGDADRFPVRYMVLDRVTEPAFDYAFYPSDLYYADLAKADGGFENWNAVQTDFHRNYFGEVRGEKNKSDPINYDQVDYLPEVGVGRWPVSTVDELRNVSAKSLAYELGLSQRDEDVTAKAGMVYVGGWVDCRPQMRSWGDQLPGSWSRQWLFDSPEKPDEARHRAEQIIDLLNTGCDLLLHAGHGYPEGWDQSLGSQDLVRLSNPGRLPVIISAGCSTAYFATLPPYESYLDAEGRAHRGTNSGELFTAPPPAPAVYQTGEFNRTGLGEQLLKSGPSGAVAYFGCNTGSQPCGLTLVEGFVLGLKHEANPRLGSCWLHAVRHYHDRQRLAELKPNADWYPPSIFFQGMKFMLFGDPSLPLPQG
ncbi:MAG: C25 family cysteine peptidase [Planctomycetota bacterium]